MMHHILLIEDDPEVVNLIRLHLEGKEYAVTDVSNTADGLKAAKTGDYCLVLMDIGLPDGSGMELCKAIRRVDSELPLIMLTAQADEADKVLALELGADDYITKPFSMPELKARVKAMLRRTHKETEEVFKPDLQFRDLLIEGSKRKVSLAGNRLDLTVKEFDLLWLLASNPGKTFNRKELLQKIWGTGFEGYEHTITSHVNRLRIKLEKDINHPAYILTAWGSGYRFAE